MKKGFSIVEILVALSLLAILVTFVSFTVFFAIRQVNFYQRFVRANYLAQEGQEIAREYREEKEEEINGFIRKITFEQVFRDGQGNIAETGSLDPETLMVVVSVSFNDNEVKLINYLTSHYE